MANSTPSSSPSEAPEIKSIKELQDKKTDTLKYLQDMTELTDEDKKNFALEYENALKALESKTEAEKAKDIGSIKEELKQLKAGILNEKQDETEELDDKEDDETADTTKQKLNVEKEIRGQLNKFKQNIENKLNAPTPAENPADKNSANPPLSKDLPALTIDPNLPDIPEFKNPQQKGWLVEFIINWLGTTGIGGWIRKFIMGYDTMEEMTDTMAAMKNIMSIKKESPISAIINLTHITEYDFRDILRKNPRLDFSNMRNVEAAFLGKHAEDTKLEKYHCIYNGIGDMAEKIGKTDSPGYDPMGRFSELLGYSKKPEFAPDYTEDKVDTPVAVDVPKEKTEAEKLEERKEEIKTAEEADKNLEQAKKDLETTKTLPDSADKWTKVTEAETKVTEAELAVKNIVEASKTKVSGMLKQSEDELKDTILTLEQKNQAKATLKNQLDKDKTNKNLESELDTLEWEIKDLTIKQKALEEAIGKIKKESEKFPKDANDTKKISAVEATKAAQETERLALESIGIIEIQQEKEKNDDTEKQKENAGIEKEIDDANNKIQEIIGIIGVDWKRALSRKQIIDVKSQIGLLRILETKIKDAAKNKPELTEKYNALDKSFSSIENNFRFKNIRPVSTDYDENSKDYDLNKDQVNNVNFSRLIAVSPDQDVAYFYVTNCAGESGYMRLILSKKDSEYTDLDGTPAAFYKTDWKATVEEEANDIDDIEHNVGNGKYFSTIELNGTGWISDDLDWLNPNLCDWKQKIQGLGLSIPDETAK